MKVQDFHFLLHFWAGFSRRLRAGAFSGEKTQKTLAFPLRIW